MEDMITLRGLAFSKYPNITELSKELGWSRQKTTRIINNVQEPTEDEMIKLIEVFNISSKMVIPIFFPKVYTKCTFEEGA